MATITPNVNVDRLARKVSHATDPEALRQSEGRRAFLERWARILSDDPVEVELNSTESEPAQVDMTGAVAQITVPSWEMSQPVTDYRRKAFDMLMQRTLTLHEVGHINYTDNIAFTEAIEDISPSRREQFRVIWNALEDGAIEELLRREFAVADELEVMNANLTGGDLSSRKYSVFDATLQACLDLAVYDSGRTRALLDPDNTDHQFVDEEARTTFVSEIITNAESAAADVVTDPDPVSRTERIRTFWEEIRDSIEEDADAEQAASDLFGKGDHSDSGSGSYGSRLEDVSNEAGQKRAEQVLEGTPNQSQQRVKPDSASDKRDSATGYRNESGEGNDTQTASGREGKEQSRPSQSKSDGLQSNHPQSEQSQTDQRHPADASSTDGESESDQPKESRQCSETQPDRDADEKISTTKGEQATTDDLTDSSQAETYRSDSEDNIYTEDVAGNPDHNQPLETAHLEHVTQQSEQMEEELEAFASEIKTFADILRDLESESVEPQSLEIPGPSETRENVWPTIKKQGTRLTRILEEQLQQERRSDWRRSRPRGRVDSRSLTRFARNDPRIFRQRERPDEKNYRAVLILDRSGSMSNDVTYAEEAGASLAYSLEELNIETCVLDMYRSKPRLVKPFGADVKTSLDRLVVGKASGGTPLSSALRLARKRLNDGEGHPFVIVITDGQPDDQDAYLEELRSTPFPVVGIYLEFSVSGIDAISKDIKESARLFDRRRIITDTSAILPELRGLCREVMF